MKEIFENKKKLYLFIIVLFLLTSIVTKLVENNIANILVMSLFPIYFAGLTYFYNKKNTIEKEMPLYLTLIYLALGYILIPSLMKSFNVIIAFLSSFITLKVLEKIKKEKKQEKKEEIKEETKKIVSLLLPLVSIIALEFYYSICTFDVARIPITFLPMIIGIIIIYSVYLIILSIFRKTGRSTIIFSIIFLIVFIINEGRIYYTSDTLLITDVLFLQNAGEVAGFADITLINCINFLLYPTILVSIIMLYIFKLAKKYDVKFNNTKQNIIMPLCSLLILTFLFMPIEPVNKFVIENAFDIYDKKDLTITASNTRYFYRYGVLPGIYGKLIETNRIKPNDYNEEELRKILENSKDHNGTWKKPNVIVVFSESFWDISKLEGVTFDKEITPNFNKYKSTEKTINMISPSYGGMSSNVEFEILTGGSLNYFSKGYTPYMQLFQNGKSETNPTIIKELKNNGYKTKILNSSSANMFNCDKVYDFYEVDERNHLFDEIDLNGKYVSDEYLTDRIIEYFNNKDKDEKTFFFTITMGGHMPYYEGKYDNYHVNIVDSIYEDDVNEVVHSYAEGIYLADKELGRLYDYINTLDEETIVVFFGDHLPHLTTPDGKDALFKTNFLNSDYTLDSVYKQYNTTALILSNYDIEKDDINYLSPDLLFTYILNNMDLKLSPFYRWMYETIDVLPSSNYVVAQDKDGKLYYTLALENEMKEMYELRKKMQYLLFK